MATVLITGASAGIGRATAIKLAAQGHHVIAAARNLAALEHIKRTAKGKVDVLALDVTSQESVDAAKAEVPSLVGQDGLDVLINNAGYALTGPLEQVTDADLKAQFETNVFGPMRMVRAFLPQMRERRRGRIINISSVVGRLALPFFGPYNSTKHAIEALSDALRNELRPFGIEVVIIEPGAINTGFGEIERKSLETYATGSPYAEQVKKVMAFQRELHPNAAKPETAAAAIVRAVEARKPRARYVVPFLPNRAFIALAEFLPTEASDAVIQNITGLRGVRP
ncbi:MAG: SDR family oxidoreductase [Alphaproteobacteria bacterium]|nr:SDR family oxidoreductase [Alphaproteobacteria bacterium]